MPNHYTSTPRACPQCGTITYRPPSHRGNYCCHACSVQDRIRTLAERFWSHVEKSEQGCWLWTASRMVSGYGQFGIRKGVLTGAHRMAWKLTFGAIPDGLLVCHKCDNKLCVRPDHLFLGTASDNVHDMIAKGRHSGITKPESFRRGEKHHWRLHPEMTLKGGLNPNAKLTTEQVIAIRERGTAGSMPRKEIAAEYGVATALVGQILRGTAWRHVQIPTHPTQ